MFLREWEQEFEDFFFFFLGKNQAPDKVLMTMSNRNPHGWNSGLWKYEKREEKKKESRAPVLFFSLVYRQKLPEIKYRFFCHSLENIGPAVTEQIKRTALQNHGRFQTRSHAYTLPYLAMLELSLILSGERLSLPPALPNAPQLHLNTPLCSLKSFHEKKQNNNFELLPSRKKKDDCTTIQAGN